MLRILMFSAEKNLSENQFSILLKLISCEKQERINKLHLLRDAQNTLIGDVLARMEICRQTNLNNKQLIFSANEFGKPFLTNEPSICFNISHSSNYIVCAVDDKAVGIDIEQVKPINIKIAERYFALDEARFVLSGSDEENTKHFYEIWTKKESFLKREGTGLSKSLLSFNVLKEQFEYKLYYHLVFNEDNMICHVCTTQEKVPSLRRCSIDELIAFADSLNKSN